MNTILVPLDGSDFSAQILPAIKKYFAPGANALVLYTVGTRSDGHIGLPSRPASADIPVPVYESQQDIELARHPIYESQEFDSRASALQDLLEAKAGGLRGEGYTVTVESDFGNPAESIIERAGLGTVDMVAMTTHGRSGITRLIFGSVAEQVVRNVAVPVFLVRPVVAETTESGGSG